VSELSPYCSPLPATPTLPYYCNHVALLREYRAAALKATPPNIIECAEASAGVSQEACHLPNGQRFKVMVSHMLLQLLLLLLVVGAAAASVVLFLVLVVDVVDVVVVVVVVVLMVLMLVLVVVVVVVWLRQLRLQLQLLNDAVQQLAVHEAAASSLERRQPPPPPPPPPSLLPLSLMWHPLCSCSRCPLPRHRTRRVPAARVSPLAAGQALGQKGVTLWMTGYSGSGKSTIARALEEKLVLEYGLHVQNLDGDNVRTGESISGVYICRQRLTSAPSKASGAWARMRASEAWHRRAHTHQTLERFLLARRGLSPHSLGFIGQLPVPLFFPSSPSTVFLSARLCPPYPPPLPSLPAPPGLNRDLGFSPADRAESVSGGTGYHRKAPRSSTRRRGH